MAIKDTYGRLKPYLAGAAIGAVAAVVIGFGSGWVVQASTMERNVHEAKVAVLAEVCQSNAVQHWRDQGREMTALRGWRNEERKQLATQFAPSLADSEAIREAVVDSCDRLLRAA